MLTNRFTTSFSQNAAVKKFWKSVNIWQTYRQNFVAYFFYATLYTQIGPITYARKKYAIASK